MIDSKITIYTSGFCAYCKWAKEMLHLKDLTYNEIRIDINQDEAQTMVRRSGGVTSVPQIFVGDVHVGGYTDMVALDQQGEFDPLTLEA